MKLTARTTLTPSLLATLVLALAVTVAGCTSGPGAIRSAASGGNSAAGGSGSTAGGSAGGGGAAAGGGSAGAGGGATVANVPAAARDLICPPVVEFGRLRPLLSPAIPAGFEPVAVVQCLSAGGIAPVNGERSYVEKEAAVTGLGPLLTALRAPSARPAGVGPAAACPVMVTGVPRLALIGRDGAVIYPRIPVTVCGEPIQPVVESLGALQWIMLGSTGPLQGQPPDVEPPGVEPPGPVAPQTAALPSS
jgi:hypothetical protein